MSRKKQLTARAHRYADAYSGQRFTWENGAYGFEDGYRAAMRDLRKELSSIALWRAHTAYGIVRRWLRPLR